MTANPDDWDEGLIQIIGRAIDKPSLYMGGASRLSRRRAAEVLESLGNYGYKIILDPDAEKRISTNEH